MSEKVTFGELIESIAEETDHSKQFTHDFLKDFVDVINGGLEEDGKVNIAGFGKFELQRVDEREGYNPQTEEKITIPAHNKVVFKPYKDLRELVNAPYAHMEPQLIEEENSDGETSDEDSSTKQQVEDSRAEDSHIPDDKDTIDNTEHVENQAQTDSANSDRSEGQELNEDDFIPTAPPTSHRQDQDKSDDEDQTETDQASPFDFEKQQDEEEKLSETSTTESIGNKQDDDNGDIVEFNASQSDTDDDLFEEFISSAEKEQDEESSKEATDTEEAQLDSEKDKPRETEDQDDKRFLQEEKNEEKPTGKSEEELLAEEVEKLEEAAEDLKQDQSDESDQKDEEIPLHTTTKRRPSARNASYSYVAAAAIILLLIAGGAWYYSTLPTNNDVTLISSNDEQTSSANAAITKDNNNQQQSSQQQAANNQQKTQNQSQSATQSTATQPTNNPKPKNQAVEIEKGQTLWSLAEDRYGNPRLWPWIYGNNGSLDDPDLIYAGSSLSVPLPSGPRNTLSGTDSVGVAKGYIATYKWYKSNGESKARNHLWAAKLYHDNLQQLADIPIDKTDLSYANKAR